VFYLTYIGKCYQQKWFKESSTCCDTPVTELLVPDILQKFSSSTLSDCLICEYEGLCPFKMLETPNPVTQCHITCTEHSTVGTSNLTYIHSFHWHVQKVTIPCHSQELLPFLSVIYPFHQIVFHPPSLHFALYFLVYLSALFPNSNILFFEGILLSSILCTCPNQCNLFNPAVTTTVQFFNHCTNFFIG